MLRGRFYSDEQITSTDLDNACSYLLSNTADLFNNFVYNGNTIILSGLTVTAQATASGQVNVATGIASQNGYPIHITTQQVVNILSGSPGTNTWGTGEASGSSPRIDIVVAQYATQDGNPQTRNVNNNGTITSETLNTNQQTYYALNVVHGTASSTPVAPSVPSGWFLLATINVPANATTIVSGDITDNTVSLKTSGGWLSNVSGGILSRNDSASSPELDTVAGITLKLGTTGGQLLDNTAAGYLDVSGSTNGVRFTGATIFQSAPKFSAGITGTGTTGALTAGGGILNTANTWGATQTIGAGSGLVVSGSGSFGGLITANAGITGTGTTGALTAGSGILGTANTFTAGQMFNEGLGFSGVASGDRAIDFTALNTSSPYLDRWANINFTSTVASGATWGIVNASNSLAIVIGVGSSNFGNMTAAGQVLAQGGIAELGYNVNGTNGGQIVSWFDNNATYGVALVENNKYGGLALVNKGTSAYNGLAAGQYTVPVIFAPNGYLATQANMAANIGTNASYVARNVIDDGAGGSSWAGGATFNGGATIASGETLDLSGATVSGAPTFSALPTFSAGITGTGTTGALTAGSGILGTANTFTQPQVVNTTPSGGAAALRLITGTGTNGGLGDAAVAFRSSSNANGATSFTANERFLTCNLTAGGDEWDLIVPVGYDPLALWALTGTASPYGITQIARWTNSGDMHLAGNIASLAGMATNGLGVAAYPTIEQAVELTTTSATTICSYAVPANGTYMMSAYVAVGATANLDVTVTLNWVDPTNGTGQQYDLLSAVTFSNANTSLPLATRTVYAKAGTNVSIVATATVANEAYITGTIARLS